MTRTIRFGVAASDTRSAHEREERLRLLGALGEEQLLALVDGETSAGGLARARSGWPAAGRDFGERARATAAASRAASTAAFTSARVGVQPVRLERRLRGCGSGRSRR